MPSCSVKWCGKDSGRYSKKKDNITFHRFPKNSETKSKWIDATKRENWFPSPKSVICSRHFTSDCFFITKSNRRLIEGSIPTLHIPIVAEHPEPPPPLGTPSLRPKPAPESHYVLPVPTIFTVSTTKLEQATKPALTQPTEDSSIIQKRLENHITELTSKLADKRKLVKKLQSHTRYLEKKVELLKHIIRQSVMNSEDAADSKDIAVQVRKKLSEAKKYEIICKLKKHKEKKLKTKQEKHEDNNINMEIEEVAEFDPTMPKPKVGIGGKPGFTTESLVHLKALAFQSELMCTLIIDEIKLRPDVEYNSATKRTYRNAGMGDDETTESVEDSTAAAIVFLIVPINNNVQVPIGYFFVNGISSESKADLVRDALSMCHHNDIAVKALTFVGTRDNIAMATKLGCSFKPNDLKCSFKHPHSMKDVYIVLDIVHLTDIIQNSLEYYKIFVDCEDNVIDWTLIKKLKQSQESEIKQLGNKVEGLNKIRKSRGNFSDIVTKVKIDSQVISRNVAEALSFCGKELNIENFRNAETTARVIKMLHNVLDILNSKAYGQDFQQALNDNNHLNIFKELRECKKLLLTLRIKLKKNNRRAQIRLIDSPHRIGFIGLLIAIESLRAIYFDIEGNTNVQISYLPYNKLSHDPMKLFFCDFLAYSNGKPTERLFESFYKKSIDCLSNSSSCCKSLQYFSNYSTPIDRINLRYQRFKGMDESNENKFNILRRSKFLGCLNEGITAKVSESLTKKIKCAICISGLITTKHVKYRLRYFNHFNFKGLRVSPSKSVIKICRWSEITLKRLCLILDRNRLVIKTMNSIVGEAIFAEISNHDNNHLIDLIRCVIEQYLLIRCDYENINNFKPLGI